MRTTPTPRFTLGLADGERLVLPPCHGMGPSAHVFDARSIAAVEAAMATGRPLLVRGEPGTGKSQLARAVARKLERALVMYTVDARTETRDLQWTIDTVRRLAEAQVMAALCNKTTGFDQTAGFDVSAQIALSRFVKPGPLWWAFEWASAATQAGHSGCAVTHEDDALGRANGAVLLVDEIDKADVSVPNGLLDALGHGRFQTPDDRVVSMNREKRPIVIITTNEERSLPDAFLRRCLVLKLDLPTDEDELEALLVARGRAHFPVERCADGVLHEAARMLIEDRAEVQTRDLSPPGVAEYIDLLDVVTAQFETAEDQIELLKTVRKFALQKHPDEQEL